MASRSLDRLELVDIDEDHAEFAAALFGMGNHPAHDGRQRQRLGQAGEGVDMGGAMGALLRLAQIADIGFR